MTQSFSVRSAEDLFGLLEHPEVSVRLALLKHIVASPERAAAYGQHEGRDLTEELIRLFRESRWEDFRLLVMHALLALDDPRVLHLCIEELHHSTSVHLMLLVAKRVKREPEGVRRDLAPLLFDASKDKVRVVANLLRDCGSLPAHEQLQVSLYALDPVPEPSFKENQGLWFSALEGPRFERARALLKAQGKATLVKLSGHWRELSVPNFAWLLSVTTELVPEKAAWLVEEALTTGDEAFAKAALDGVAKLEHPEDFATRVAPYIEHPNPKLRLAALRTGVLSLYLEQLAKEEVVEVRLAAITRLPHAYGEKAIPTLLTLLEDESWQVRAAATNAIVRLGKAAVEAVKPVMRSEHVGARRAAAQVLTQLDETLWLETLLV